MASGTQYDPLDNVVITSFGFDFVNGTEAYQSFPDLHVPNNTASTSIGTTTELVGHEDVIMSMSGGGAFNLQQFLWGSRAAEAGTWTVIGTYAGGGTVSQGFTLDGLTTTFQLFVLPGTFVNLSSVTFQHIGGTTGWQNLDNIVATPVPEPATLLLLGTGLGAVAARRRLKKRA